MSRNPYSQAIKELKRKKREKMRGRLDVPIEILEWREYWKEAGPIRFAEEQLRCPPDVPPHQELGRVPEYIILSDDQRGFLYDLWKNEIRNFILAASRGAGKTFTFAIYTCWRVCCFDYFTMTVMGGTGEQSEKIKEYIDFWRRTNDEINYCLHRSVRPSNRPARVESRWDAYSRFPACSDASARGPHVTQLLIDEVCAGEAKGKGGAAAIRSARYQLTSSPNSLLGMSSTAQYILGTFYEVWTKADELGYKRYRWSIARHVSETWYKGGTKEPNWPFIDEILYKDRDPNNWIPNVWWMTDRDIKNFRKNSTDGEWLVEMLGGISKGSGLVFSRDDLKSCICTGERYTSDHKECEICEPYTDNCPMMKKLGLSLAMISDRSCGIDFGEIVPNAMTITGRRGKMVFVLYSDERTGLRSDEILNWIFPNAKKYHLWQICADPEERAMREAIENEGYNTPHIWAGLGGGGKVYFVTNTKRFIELHFLFIPKAFEYLTNSLAGLSYDDRGRIRKHNDHSFDSLVYCMSNYHVDELDDPFYGKTKDRGISKIW